MTPADIKRMRETAGHTQAQAAEIVGVIEDSWRRWESGKMGFKESHLRIYAIKTGQLYPDDEKLPTR